MLWWLNGSIDWCCMPRFDSGSCFGAVLDPQAGACTITMAAWRGCSI
jgi:hypothetical protein